MSGVLHTQTLQQGRKCTWLTNTVKIRDLFFLSSLSCLLLPFPSSILRVVWLPRVSTPLSKPQELLPLAEFALTLVLVPDLAPYQISDETLRANLAAPMPKDAFPFIPPISVLPLAIPAPSLNPIELIRLTRTTQH